VLILRLRSIQILFFVIFQIVFFDQISKRLAVDAQEGRRLLDIGLGDLVQGFIEVESGLDEPPGSSVVWDSVVHREGFCW